jgi:hypothetical protein
MLALWLSSFSSYSSLKDVWYIAVVGVGIVCFERLTFFVWNQEEGLWVMTEHRCRWLPNVVGQFIHLFSIIWNCNCLY